MERLGLLTLIILGEGVIVMLKAVNTVEKGSDYGRGWSASIFFAVACSVGIVYMLYMFYFDYTPRGVHYGTIRQQFWAVLHFPFHMAIVLAVEGLRQLSTWWSFNQAYNFVWARFDAAAISSPDPQQSWEAFLDEVAAFLQYLYDDGNAKIVMKHFGSIQEEIASLRATSWDDKSNNTVIDLYQIHYDMLSGFAEWYGIKVPKSKEKDLTVAEIFNANLDVSAFNPILEIMKVYDLVYSYFFISLAVVFCMYGIFGLFVRRRKDGWDYFSVSWRFAIALSFIALERLKLNENLYRNFMRSPWPIPMVAFIMLFALFADKIVGLLAYKTLRAELQRRHRRR